jgi:amino acid transporter
MTAANPNNRPNQPRVQGSRVPGAHPGDTVIRRDRYPYAAPSPVENLLYWLTGSPIASSQALHERLTKLKALAVFSSDALSSVAYATEEILLVLVLAGPAAYALAAPISLTIALLLFIVALSYNQTIHAYPTGGGSFIVAKENIGVIPGLVAGASLLIDYVLTVAVSISSGVAALTSALPGLGPYRVALALIFVTFIAVSNLRGLRESSTIFMIPTYAFIVSIFAVIGAGVYRYFILGLTDPAPTTNVLPAEAIEPLGLLLILRAFAAGCTALTGVEAIADGVPAFKPPEAKNAARTLAVMATILISMFLGITFLTQLYRVIPEADHETVISQLGRTALGSGPFYWFLQAATMLILVLAANTSFQDFPRLSSIIAREGYLPRLFVRVGQRLVFTTGILELTLF